MNTYQKVAVFIVRMAGAIFALVGISGPLCIAVGKALGQPVLFFEPGRWLGSIFWTVGGVALLIASKPIGRFFGRGLD